MKLKYFIRGLGVGIIITAILLGISYKSKLSDEAIITKAKKLGMVFDDNSGQEDADIKETPEPVATEQPAVNTPEAAEQDQADVTSEPQITDNPIEEKGQEADNNSGIENIDNSKSEELKSEDQTSSDMAQKTAEPVDNGASSETVKNKEKIILEINRGDWSRKVAEKLEALGLVDKPDEFDEFLVNNGYADRIRVGRFEVDSGASFEDIAKAITE